ATLLIMYRRGNEHTYSKRETELIFVKWPMVVRSLALSQAAKRTVYGTQPWKHLGRLLRLRGAGLYSLDEYRQWIRPQLEVRMEALSPVLIALLPGPIVNMMLVLYYSLARGHLAGVWLQTMRESRFHV